MIVRIDNGPLIEIATVSPLAMETELDVKSLPGSDWLQSAGSTIDGQCAAAGVDRSRIQDDRAVALQLQAGAAWTREVTADGDTSGTCITNLQRRCGDEIEFGIGQAETADGVGAEINGATAC